MEQISIPTIAERVTDEASAYKFLEELRWNGNPVCPHCGNDAGCYYLAPKDAEGRKTNRGKVSARRVWKCKACRKQFSVLTGTIFHGTKISVWIFVVFEMCSSKNGVAAREIERKYGLTAKSAWFMTQRIREAMKREPLAGMFTGTVVSDETYIGGKPKNKHRQGRPARYPEGGKGRAGLSKDKTAVLSLVNKETGEVRSQVLPTVTGPTLRKAIAEQVNMATSHLQTDGLSAYRQIGEEFQSHEWVDHSAYEYVRDNVSTNMAEGFFSQLKRSVDGTHHHVSPEHLHRYLAEFDFRYTTRHETDTDRMRMLVGRIDGRRLSYRPLLGEHG
jgi:transposase-like protein